MSRAPETASQADTKEVRDYVDAFRQVFRLHEQGLSFSGRERHCAFLNTTGVSGDQGRAGRRVEFADISAVSGLDLIDDGRGVARVDWDQDGDLDLWVANRTAPRLRYLNNDSPAGKNHLVLELRGTRSNRDAIGARAELILPATGDQPAAKLLRTVRAGEAFLSQSSRRLHFGLGEHAGPLRLAVTWPDGTREEIAGAEPNKRWLVVEGSARAEPMAARSVRVELPPSAPVKAEVATPRRVFFANQVPLPPLQWVDLDDQPRYLHTEVGGPMLINLWASWCRPCDAELRALASEHTALEAAGLAVWALSVDGLDPGQPTDREDALRFLARLETPFAAGFANRPLLDKLQLLSDRLFSHHQSFAVPTSFLVTAEGALAAIYRGPVEPALLLEDIARMGARALERRRLASPFPGQWLGSPEGLRLTSIAQRFLDEGHAEDALFYLERSLADRPEDAQLFASLGRLLIETGRREEAEEAYRSSLRLDPTFTGAARGLADLLAEDGRIMPALELYEVVASSAAVDAGTWFNYANTLARAGRSTAARQSYLAAIELSPDFAAALNNLGALELQTGDHESARSRIERALELDSRLADAHANLGLLAVADDRLEEAADRLGRAVELLPSAPTVRNNYGVVLLRLGRLPEALEQFERALALDPGYADARDNLAATRRALGRAVPQ